MNVPIVISLLRGLFALLIFSSSTSLRLAAIIGAAASDVLDGYLARRWNQISKLGIILDPLMDKLFVAVALVIFYLEGSLTASHICFFLLRDISLLLFFLVLAATASMRTWSIRSFFCGKVHTTLQFIVLSQIAVGMDPSQYVYWAMGVFGAASFFELLLLRKCAKIS